MKVLIAPDSFKGTLGNIEVARAISEGWLSVRPEDQVITMPMADGGEGTLETIARQNAGSLRIPIHLNHESAWLLLQDGTAIVELADICGITRVSKLEPLVASTFDLGLVLKAVARDPRVKKLVIAVGGSASTDGGVGALTAMGGHFLDSSGLPIALGGAGLCDLESINLNAIPPAPQDGVICLVDVKNPLLGPFGSAAVFSPQKGADAAQVLMLEASLSRLLEVSKHEDFPGAGAAGGTPFGLSLAWEINLESGALAIATMIGLYGAIADSDLVITGEGRLDAQSAFGKVVGVVTDIAQQFQKRVSYCVGSSEESLGNKGISLAEIAPSLDAAMNHPNEWLVEAGAKLAKRENS